MFILPFLAACTGIVTPVSDAVLDAQLEALSVSSEATEATGALVVSGSDRDLTLTVGDDDFSVHTPAATEFSSWDGGEVELRVEWTDLDLPEAALRDASGLAWLADAGTGGSLAEAEFGEGFVGYGESLGQARDGDYVVDYQSVVFSTDDGEVEAQAGQPVTLRLGGQAWRATVITAYTAEQAPGTPVSDCMGMPDLLAYELVRVEADETWTPRTRADGAEAARVAGCGG